MRTGVSGTATLRHVGLVALEALLIAAIVWIAAMSLAGATQSGGGIIPAARADDARNAPEITVPDGVFGETTVAVAKPGGAGTWIHATCSQGTAVVLDQWMTADANSRANLVLGPTRTWPGGGAACTAEEGYFGANGRWRVRDSATFSVAP